MSDGTQGPVIVTGAPVKPAPNGSVPVRREVQDLKRNYPEQWCLYIRGLQKFQQVASTQPLSYYQIAGIHGRPYRKWPDEPWNTMKRNPKSGSGGFCTHTSILFLPWHRPYLALFEQELYKHVQEAGKDFAKAQAEKGWQEKKDWTGAAQDFRMPFWDWADPEKPVIPTEALTPTIRVWIPETYPVEKEVENPLYAYKFSTPSQEGTLSNFQYTYRYGALTPLKTKTQDLTEQLEKILRERIQRFKNTNLTERVCYILQAYERYGAFSNDAFNAGRPEIYGSLEDIHNSIHTETGGDGHMGGIAVSAFDPIFWLHHTNIDRMFAIWQAIHGQNSPEPYVVPSLARSNNFTTAAEQEENDKTPLKPFSSPNSDFWKSKDVKETKTFGYCYPETEDWKFSGKPEVYRKDIIDKIRVLYPAGSLANIIRDKTKDSKASITLLESRAETVAQAPLQQLEVKRQVKDLAPDNKYLEWITNLKAKKHTLGASFNVHVFLGPITEENPILWHTEKNHVGAFAVLGQPPDTGCEKCQSDRMNDVQVTAQIPLTVALAERYLANRIDGLTPEIVRPYLQENLHWRVTRVDGTEVPRGDVEELVVSVVTNEVTIPENPDDLPIYAPTVDIYPRITMKGDGVTPRGDGTGLTNETQA